VFVPLDGLAPDNVSGRQGLLLNVATGIFRRIPEVGAAGKATPLPNFLGISSTAPCTTPAAPNSHFCR
jgi:hypothetical protein